jgi:hypothetical protein
MTARVARVTRNASTSTTNNNNVTFLDLTKTSTQPCSSNQISNKQSTKSKQPKKRPLGRPPGSKNKKNAVEIIDDDDAECEGEDEGEGEEEYINEAAEEDEESNDDDDDEEFEPSKKKKKANLKSAKNVAKKTEIKERGATKAKEIELARLTQTVSNQFSNLQTMQLAATVNTLVNNVGKAFSNIFDPNGNFFLIKLNNFLKLRKYFLIIKEHIQFTSKQLLVNMHHHHLLHSHHQLLVNMHHQFFIN